MNDLQVMIDGTNQPSVWVGYEDPDGNGWLLPLDTYTVGQADGKPQPTPPPLDTEQLTVWAAQLRVVAQMLDSLAAEMQPAICYPTTGSEGEESNGL